jgi:hypothetical protein
MQLEGRTIDVEEKGRGETRRAEQGDFYHSLTVQQTYMVGRREQCDQSQHDRDTEMSPQPTVIRSPLECLLLDG